MKILAISFAYNEIDFIKYKYKWCIENDIDLYIIDNESDDGTLEYLQENKINSHKFDTNGEFHLKKLQAELINTIHNIQPEWFIYMGVDEFFFMKDNIKNEIIKANAEGFNAIQSDIYNIFNTGESYNTNPFDTFFYYSNESPQVRIGKYNPFFRIAGDNYLNKKYKIIEDSFLLNYGMTKSKEQREKTYQRRIKAWKNGLNPLLGVHYTKADNRKWIWEKESLKDLRFSKINWVFDRLSNLI